MSELLIKSLTVTCSRKLLTVTDCPDWIEFTYDRQSNSKASARALLSWSRDISRCADSRPCELAPARPSRDHNLLARPLFWDCWSGIGIGAPRDRTKFAHPIRNLVSLVANRAWRWLRPCRALPPAICKREFLLRDQSPVLPVACKQARHCLPRRFAAAPRAIDFHNRPGPIRIRRWRALRHARAPAAVCAARSRTSAR